MKEGGFAGQTGARLDGRTLNLVGCAFFAMLLRENPAGLPTAPYGNLTPTVAKAIQQTVWKVVREHPESGVK